ncbi:MAG: hypothetical protein ACPGSL_05625 [Vicingaceae bacterium]
MNLENLNVQELNIEEQKNVDGGAQHQTGSGSLPSNFEAWWKLFLASQML